ncbi:MAG TPA: S8 family peptidase, partial [Steroidobacteraceae bacterium]
MRCLWGWLAVALVAVQVVAAQPPAAALVTAAPTERLIVKLRGSLEFTAQQAAPARVAALIERNGLIPVEVRHIVAGIHLVRVQAGQASPTQAQVLARLRADPEVEYAEVDQRRYPNAEPDDPLFINQWYLQNAQPAALDAIDAWNMTSGSPGLVIADLDTGVLFDHPDLRNDSANRLLPGYNLISNADIANNGYGRGPDASDPGDWISASDLTNPVFANCTIANSSWHGTRVAGVLGALTNNQTGVAGLTWQGWIEPVRVLGKCGGYDSDIIAGMAWAAGNAVEGVPINPYPARIVNMSLGSVGSCPSSYQQMVDELVSEGVLVVVSAGNEGGPVDAPANCSGVLAVAGLREDGTKVGYSSLGPQVTLSAPAGNCVNTGAGQPCLFSIETTTNSGTTVPVTNTYTDEYNYNIGTSFSAPQVAATAGLMLAVNGNLSPAQLMQRLQEAAQPFPVSSDPGVPVCHVPADATDLQTSECNCTAATCGVGMANADQAVIGALRPIAAVVLPLEFPPGSTITMDGSGSAAACNASLVTY